MFKAKLITDWKNFKEDDFVALKQYKPWVFNEKNQRERINLELKTGMKLNCDSIVKSFDLVEQDGSKFLVMEYLDGITLENYLKNNKPLTFEQVIEISYRICKGLSVMHSAEPKIIHRDIKPANIMITKDRGAVIMDLGVIKIDKNILTIGKKKFLGTIAYSAPEYLFGETTENPSIDIYCFGSILYEMIKDTPIINPDMLFTNQIIIKSNLRVEDNFYIDTNEWNRFGLKKSIFISNLLQGTLGRLNSRLTSEQLCDVFKNKVWDKQFFHLITQETIKFWPEVPIQHESLKKKLKILETKLPLKILNFLASRLYSIILSEKPNNIHLKCRQYLYKFGFFLPSPIYRGLLKINKYVNLTDFGWQFLLIYHIEETSAYEASEVDVIMEEVNNFLDAYNHEFIEFEGETVESKIEKIENTAKEEYVRNLDFNEVLDTLNEDDRIHYNELKHFQNSF